MEKELILLDYDAKDAVDAITKAGMLLLDRGYIQNNYIDEMIETYKKYGPYIVITKNVAIPHAKITGGSIKSGYSIIRLKKPINFGNIDNDPVKIVIGLSSKDNDEHIDNIKKIVYFLEDEEIMRKILTLDVDDIYNAINNI